MVFFLEPLEKLSREKQEYHVFLHFPLAVAMLSHLALLLMLLLVDGQTGR